MSVNIISDSSFFICFLDDIKRSDFLRKMIASDSFKFIIGKVVREEIRKSKNYSQIEPLIVSKTESFEYYNFEELLRPIMHSNAVSRGEGEAIAIAYVLNYLGKNIILILDDETSRNFVYKNLNELSNKMVGTIGFIDKCFYEYGIFSKEEVLLILNSIKASKFS
jgi:predicted nucleic acid-binding protein